MFQGELCQNITAKAIESVRGVSNLVDITKHPSYKVRYISESVILRPKPGGRRGERRGRGKEVRETSFPFTLLLLGHSDTMFYEKPFLSIGICLEIKTFML